MNEQKINRGTHGDSLLILVSLETLSKKPPLQAWNAKWWEHVTAGYKTLAGFINTSPDEIAEKTAKAIKEHNLPCIVPLPKEVRTHIAVAKAFMWNSDTF